MEEFANVVVVGAGLSGLAVATGLHSRGIPFCLLEARDRLGGRILSADGFDLGPAWFWPWHNRMKQLLEKLNIPSYQQQDEGIGLFQGVGGIQQIPSGYTGVSYRVDDGVGAIVERLASDLPQGKIELSSRVSSIQRVDQSGSISIRYKKHGTSKRILASRVVLAVPPRIIVGLMSFQPRLPVDFQEELRRVPTWMAGQSKAVIEYREPFWREKGLSGTAFSQLGPLGQIHDASLESVNKYALMGFLGLPPAKRVELSRAELESSVTKQLESLFGNQARDHIGIRVMDWATESETATDLDLEPLTEHPAYGLSQMGLWEDRLILASTEVAHEHGGYLEGALEASEMTLSVLDALNEAS